MGRKMFLSSDENDKHILTLQIFFKLCTILKSYEDLQLCRSFVGKQIQWLFWVGNSRTEEQALHNNKFDGARSGKLCVKVIETTLFCKIKFSPRDGHAFNNSKRFYRSSQEVLFRRAFYSEGYPELAYSI